MKWKRILIAIAIALFITKLRHRLEHDPRLRIVNVRGIGYKLLVV